jgi:hypothetical protein
MSPGSWREAHTSDRKSSHSGVEEEGGKCRTKTGDEPRFCTREEPKKYLDIDDSDQGNDNDRVGKADDDEERQKDDEQ